MAIVICVIVAIFERPVVRVNSMTIFPMTRTYFFVIEIHKKKTDK